MSLDTLSTAGSSSTDGKSVGRSTFYCCSGHPDPMAQAVTLDDIAVPYAGPIPSALVPGRLTSLGGYLPITSNQFTVALTCGRRDDADIAFNFSVNVYTCSYVARNSRVRNKWGTEESAMGQRNRFHRDMDVYIDILTLHSAFYVAVNGRHFVKFRHRVDTAQVDTLKVSGDIHVNWVRHGVAEVYPEVCPANLLTYDEVVGPDKREGVEGEMLVPFVGKLEGSWAAGKELVIEGRVELLPCMFYIRLQRGQQHWPTPDVALSITPRFMQTRSGDSELALCSRADAAWAQETVVPKYLFKPGARFTLAVTAGDDHFHIVVNDTLLAQFHHALSPEQLASMDSVAIKGCVLIYKVSFN